jgi:small redox-active disulfide protein 2
MNIKILGSGCANCKRLEALVREVAAAQHIEPSIEKVTAVPDIMSYGVMHTPGLVVNDALVASGRMPTKGEIAGWLRER